MLNLRFALFAVPALLSLAACEDPAKDVPKATVSTAAPTPTTTAPTKPSAGASETLALDPATSSVGFVGSKVTGKHEGKFEKVSGTITLAGGKAEGGSMVVNIETASVKTDQDGLDKHLKTAEFFDVEKFPKATFTSTEIKLGGDKGATHTVTGTLELHGEKKTLTFPATITAGADGVTGRAEFAINRQDFKITYPGKKDDLIRDDVVLKLALKAPHKKG